MRRWDAWDSTDGESWVIKDQMIFIKLVDLTGAELAPPDRGPLAGGGAFQAGILSPQEGSIGVLSLQDLVSQAFSQTTDDGVLQSLRLQWLRNIVEVYGLTFATDQATRVSLLWNVCSSNVQFGLALTWDG